MLFLVCKTESGEEMEAEYRKFVRQLKIHFTKHNLLSILWKNLFGL